MIGSRIAQKTKIYRQLRLAFAASLIALCVLFAGDPRASAAITVKTEGNAIILNNAATGIAVKVDASTGAYEVSRDGRAWIGRGLVAMRAGGEMLLNVKPDGSLSGQMDLLGHETGLGQGVEGVYRSVTLNLKAGELRFDVEFRLYEDEPTVEFRQIFPDGYSGAGGNNGNKFDETGFNFPLFVADEENEDLHMIGYSNPIWPIPYFEKGIRSGLLRWGEDVVRMPLMVFDEEGNTGILSPFSDYLIRIIRTLDLSERGFGPALASGLSGELTTLPKGHVSKTILKFGTGVNATLKSWGEALLREGNKPPVKKDASFFLKHIGYWTDNGAYYYYRTEPDKNYETTLLEFNDYLKKENIPLAYFQMDSWWYPKSKIDNGVIRWEPMKDYFSDGYEGFREKLGRPLIFHNRYFAKDNDYQNEMPFFVGENGVHPEGREVFDLWANQVSRWGGTLYEQDWLGTQFDKIRGLRDNPEKAHRWLSDMNYAMAQKELDIQYCMPTMSFYFESSNQPAVTNIRSSNDYIIRLEGRANYLWWEHVYTSPIAAALGMYPFKDVFISNPPENRVDPGSPLEQQLDAVKYTRKNNPKIEYEPYYMQEALLSTLSAGPIGVGDRVEKVNKRLVLQLADENGVIAKPDEPMVPIDRMYYVNPYDKDEAFVGHTTSTVSGQTWHYILGLNMYQGAGRAEFKVSGADLNLEKNYVLYDFKKRSASIFGKNDSIESRIKHIQFEYCTLAPISDQGRALIGDISKLVSGSNVRLAGWEDDASQMKVMLAGPEGSNTELLIYSTQAPKSVAALKQNATLKKVDDAKDLSETKRGWASAGENLYLISLAGGDGETVVVEF